MSGRESMSCAKCLSSDVLTRWHERDQHRQWATGYYGECTVVKEHLHYHCRTCQFDWTGPVASAAAVVSEKEKP